MGESRRGYKKLNVSGKDALLQFADDQKAKDPDPTDESSKAAERKPSSILCWSIWICLFVAALVLRYIENQYFRWPPLARVSSVQVGLGLCWTEKICK